VTDGIKLQNDGTITVTDGDNTYKLRLPRFGQYKRIRAILIESQRVLEEEMKDTSLTDRDAFALKSNESFMRMAFHELADNQLPDDVDEWPVFLVISTTPAEFTKHWREVPLDRG
jgi:hypothetical protein